jgi:hypothetical protein
LLVFGSEALRNSFCVKKKFSESSLLEPGLARLGTDTDNKEGQNNERKLNKMKTRIKILSVKQAFHRLRQYIHWMRSGIKC